MCVCVCVIMYAGRAPPTATYGRWGEAVQWEKHILREHLHEVLLVRDVSSWHVAAHECTEASVCTHMYVLALRHE